MRRMLGAVVVVLGLTVATAFAITETQGKIIPGLESLKLKKVESKVIGGPQTFRVTMETVALITKLEKDGGTITVAGDGTLTVDEGK